MTRKKTGRSRKASAKRGRQKDLGAGDEGRIEDLAGGRQAPNAARPRVTVVMRSKNSDWVIAQSLAGLFSQAYRDFELLVVDSGSTDRTLEIVAHYPHRLIEIPADAYFPGKVLNQACEAAQGDIVVFLNSDAVPLGPETLGRLVAPFDDDRVQATLARQLPRPEADTWVRREYAESFPGDGEPPPWITLSLPMAAMRKTAWQRHPFYVDAWGSEDTEWGKWAEDHGIEVVYTPDALVMHSHNYTLEQLYGRRFIEGEADAFIYGRSENLLKAVGRMAVSTARDLVACIRDGDLADAPRLPARRAVYHWAYLKGHRHGIGRRRRGDPDARLGQKTVLDRHPSKG